jgi:hypothetical protein
MLAAMQRQQGQQYQCNKGKSTHASRAMMPAQRRNKDNSTMLAMTPARCGQTTSAMPANSSAAPAGPLKANLATTPAQRQQQGQLDAGNDPSAMRARTPVQRQKKRHCCLGQTVEGQNCCGPMPGTAMRPPAMTLSATMMPHQQWVATAS